MSSSDYHLYEETNNRSSRTARSEPRCERLALASKRRQTGRQRLATAARHSRRPGAAFGGSSRQRRQKLGGSLAI